MISRVFIIVLLAGCAADEAAFVAPDGGVADGAAASDAANDATLDDPTRADAAQGDAAHGDAAHGDAAHGDAAHGDAAQGDAAQGDAGGPFVEVGTGASTFEALEAGQRMPIIQGIQGGYHVWGGVRGAGFDDSHVQVIFRLRQDAMLLATSSDLEGGSSLDGAGLFTLAGVPVMFIDNATVDAVSGTPLILDVQVRTTAGMTLTDAIEVVPVCCEQ